jgi:alpha-tubulin suppressor-like RCC1 family protein
MLFAGTRQACMVGVDGKTKCWGYNASGQLLLPPASNAACGGGNGNGCRLLPESIDALAGVRSIAFGDEHVCAVSADGAVRCWGDASFLPEDSAAPCGFHRKCRYAPTAVSVPRAVEVASGIDASCARTQTGEVYCWGWNELGEVGDGTTEGAPCFEGAKKCRMSPVRAHVANAVQVVMGARHACARLADGTVRCWGEADSGQVGDGTAGTPCGDSTCRAEPVLVKGLDHVVSLAAGTVHTCAAQGDGTVLCWGMNGDGRLGDGTEDGVPCGYKKGGHCRLAPVKVAGLTGVVEVAAGLYSTCARTYDGKVLCWGDALGRGSKAPHLTSPQPASGVADAVALRMGETFACVLGKSGVVTCWGGNTFGQMGDGTIADRPAPTSPKL